MTGLSKALAGHALGRDWNALSQLAQDRASAFLFDTLAVGVAGRNAPYADEICGAAGRWGSGSAPVLGRPGAGLSPAYAAFLNGFQIHSQEYDCVHEAAVAHPMAAVLAALLSAFGQGRFSGRDLLTAIVAGVDVVSALGLAPTTGLKFFRPATAGIFGASLALARLHRLDSDAAVNALGHALAFASGTMQAHVEGKPGLALQVAAAARGAVEAVDLAIAGVPAAREPIEGRFGYLSLFEDAFDPARALDDLATRERITEVSWKPFPTGRAAHGAIVAVQTMMGEHGLTAANLDRFTYRAPPLIARLVGRRPHPGMSTSFARLCLPYLVAVTLTRGTVGLADFDAEALADPTVLALAERCVVEADDNPDPAAFVPAEAITVTRDGRTRSVPVDRMLGAPDWPLDEDQRRAKAEACFRFAGRDAAFASFAAGLSDIAGAEDVWSALATAFA